MTLSPKVKSELHSAFVTFASSFILVASALFAEHLRSGEAITASIGVAIVSAGLRSGFKAAYQYFISEYHAEPTI